MMRSLNLSKRILGTKLLISQNKPALTIIPNAKWSYAGQSVDQDNAKIFELRKYIFKPEGVAEVAKLTNDLFHLRTSHSKLVGFWMVEIGSYLNQSVHIWEYDNLTHRAQVRKTLSQDQNWLGQYVSKLTKNLITQENSLMSMPFWCNSVNDVGKQDGVYELATYDMIIGGPAVWGKKLRKSIEGHARLGYSDLIGVWYSDVGDHNKVNTLWRYDSFKSRTEGRIKAHQDSVVVNAVRDNLVNVKHHSSVLMNATPWSPLQ